MERSAVRNIMQYAGILLLLILAISALLMFLWNAVLIAMLPVVKLSYWQALALVVLARILFGRKLPGYIKFPERGGDYLIDENAFAGEEGQRTAFKEEWRR